MRILLPLALLLATCTHSLSAQLPHACRLILEKPTPLNPFVDSVRAETFAGRFLLTLTASEGPRRGHSTRGELLLAPVPSESVAARSRFERFALAGHATVPLVEVAAVVAAPGSAPPGAVAIRLSMGEDGRRVGGGLGEPANPELSHEKGMGVSFSGWNDTVLAGTWRSISYSPDYVADGSFCLERVPPP